MWESEISSLPFTNLIIWGNCPKFSILLIHILKYELGIWQRLVQELISETIYSFEIFVLLLMEQFVNLESSAVSSNSLMGTEKALFLSRIELLKSKYPFEIAKTTPEDKAKFSSIRQLSHLTSERWDTLNTPPLLAPFLVKFEFCIDVLVFLYPPLKTEPFSKEKHSSNEDPSISISEFSSKLKKEWNLFSHPTTLNSFISII